MVDIQQCKERLATANRVIANEKIVDGFGHISMRHPDHPDRYFLSRTLAPALVEADDIMELTLNGDPIQDDGRKSYLERFIHGAIYEARTDVMAIVHNHAHELLPFSITGHEIRPVTHVAAAIGHRVPIWDIKDKFGDTDMLVTNMEQGRDLANALGNGTTALMRGHGVVVTGGTMETAVLTALYLMVNAEALGKAERLGEVEYLTPGEVDKSAAAFLAPIPSQRAYDYLVTKL